MMDRIRTETVYFQEDNAYLKATRVGLAGGSDADSQYTHSLLSSYTSVTGVTRTSTERVKSRSDVRHASKLPVVA
jgi:hypothetical protein